VFPRLYDQGGWLPHGGVAVNMSGRPERVLSPGESAEFGATGGASKVINVSLVNPAVRDLMSDAWDAAMVVGSVV
jgi:hypothetical protein